MDQTGLKTPHALRNVTGDPIRISVRYRYSANSQSVVADGLESHMGRSNQEVIYVGWKDPDIQYHWLSQPIAISIQDSTLRSSLAKDAG